MRAKWRPTLGLVIFAVLATVTALPLVGLFLFRLYDNQLIRQTEGELIAQGTVLAASFADEVITGRLAEGDPALGARQPGDAAPRPDEPPRPPPSTLDLSRDDLPAAGPEGTPAATPPDPALIAIGRRLSKLAAEVQQVTLTGFRILDAQGRVIGGREEIGLSLAGTEEVAAALQGRYMSVLRRRVPAGPEPSLASISRGAHVRVFVALPVIVRTRVAGVVYLSRTPDNIARSLYSERHNIALAVLGIFLVTILIGYVFLRTLMRPIQELIRRTTEIQRGDRDAVRPLTHHGTREIAHLSESFLTMARSLFDRSDYISTFTAHVSHELKSPLTSIQGAAELLRDNAHRMTETERNKFLGNIIGDTERLTALVRRLRELAKADNPQLGGRTSLAPVIAKAGKLDPTIAIEATGDLGREIEMSEENATIVLQHLIDNAVQHGATAIRICIDAMPPDHLRVTVEDNGTGVSERNRARIFDPLFTTRRESGGTGMGLSIVQSMLRAHGGSIRLLTYEPGAVFEISVPTA
ncbi:MAG: two-component hybrid sensor and regulator [Rhodospirillales bacterium]|nr:two-component hybrid sensor and regulator [Rhodospirillales bacterium]